MDVVEFLESLGYDVRASWSLANVKTYKANKKIAGAAIQLYVETNNNEIAVITIDVLKEHRSKLLDYNTLLKSRCGSLKEIEPIVDKLIDIINK